jgi:hypothetical protein
MTRIFLKTAFFVQIVNGIRTLLNGECGRLDCGTIDGHLHDLLDIAGPDLD